MLIGLTLRIIIKGKKTDAWVFVNYNLIKNMDTIISFNNLFIKWFENKNLFVLSVICNKKYSSRNNKTPLIITNMIKLLFYILNKKVISWLLIGEHSVG